MGGRSPSHFKAIIALVAAANLASSLAGCGGTVRTDGDAEEPGPVNNDPDPPTGTPGGGGGGGGSDDHEVDLPQCKLGVKQAEAESCVYLFKDRCYEEQLDACGCACANKPRSTCISGFPKEDVPTEVSCF
jgi:hypothetical protein